VPPAGASGAPPSAPGATPYAYPQKGQTPQQVATDQSQCASWATQQTGFNPNAPAPAQPVTVTSPGESVGLFGGVTRRWERREERWERRGWTDPTSASTSNAQQSDAYNRALDACLTARGYTVR
jgi:hypothetical protein